MVKIITGEASLPVTALKPGQSGSVNFTPQEGVIQATAFGAQVGAVKPKGKIDPFPDEGKGKPGPEINIPQNVVLNAALFPPGAKSPRKSKIFRIRNLEDLQTPLELGVSSQDAGRAWKCVFTNRGTTEARVSGRVVFVKERREEPEPTPAEVSVGKHADLPVTFLRPDDSAILRFQPAEGQIVIGVFAAETVPKKPKGKIDPSPEGSGDDIEIKQNVRVHVELAPEGSGVVASADFRSKELLNEAQEPVIRHSVLRELAGRPWRVRFTNRGKTDIRCSARVNFAGTNLRTDIPLRVLNNGLRQLIAAVALTVRLDGKRAFIGVSEELEPFAKEALGGSLNAPLDFSGDFSDVNLFAFGVRARTDTGHPLITGFTRFETAGEEVDDFQWLGFIPTDVDIGRLAISVDIELRTFEFKTGRVLQPITTLKVDVSAFAEALGFIGADVSDQVIGEIEGRCREVVQSKAFEDAVSSYVTAGFVQIARRGHEFQDLLVEPNRFVVLHSDPHPDTPPEPPQPAEATFPRPKSVRVRPTTKVSRTNLEKIDHIVVLMQENRSFDHMLGYLSHPNHGLPQLRSDPDRDVPDGLTGNESNPRGDGGRPIVMKPYATSNINFDGRVLPPTATPFGPHHEHAHVIDQIAEGTMDGFADDFISRFPHADPQFAMSFYTGHHLPVFDELAAAYTICDRWFCSHPGPTQPNRFCTLSGHTPVLDNFAVDEPLLGYLQMPTLFEVLSKAGIEWVYYEGDIGFLRTYDRYRLDDRHVIPFDDRNDGFFRRAELGVLPAVTFIDPNFTDVPPAATANDDHAPADLALGQRFIREIYDALGSSVHWSRTLFIITYDEHGGFFDHVPPPGTKPSEQPKPVHRVHPRGDRFLGPRVPTFVISPFVGAGKVSHTIFDHTSIMATILRRFVGDIPPEFGPRPAVANDLGLLLDLAKPRQPHKLSAVTGVPIAGRLVDTRPDPRDFHAVMRRLAQPRHA